MWVLPSIRGYQRPETISVDKMPRQERDWQGEDDSEGTDKDTRDLKDEADWCVRGQ